MRETKGNVDLVAVGTETVGVAVGLGHRTADRDVGRAVLHRQTHLGRSKGCPVCEAAVEAALTV